MKIPLKFSWLILLPMTGGLAFSQPAKKADANPLPARSIFLQPANAHEGRDPFYPESTRPYESAAATNRVAEIPTLIVKGFSGTPGNYMVIINNHTFAAGDEDDVSIGDTRVHVRCVEIHPDNVIIEANGQRRKLVFLMH